MVGGPAGAAGARQRRDEEPRDQDTTETRTDGKDRGRERGEDEIVLVAGEIVPAAGDV